MMGTQAEQNGHAGDHRSSPFHDAAFLDELRRKMLKFASLQLGDHHLAEDAVQEALAGAMRNAGSFSGRSAFQTWVFAILKNKIIDILRQRKRQALTVDLMPPDTDGDEDSYPFDRTGGWKAEHKPADWGNPEADLLGKDFWRVFEACVDHLPPDQGRVFMMREFVEMDTPDICREVGITVSNLHVLLHRARLKLRGCLDKHWFAPGVA